MYVLADFHIIGIQYTSKVYLLYMLVLADGKSLIVSGWLMIYDAGHTVALLAEEERDSVAGGRVDDWPGIIQQWQESRKKHCTQQPCSQGQLLLCLNIRLFLCFCCHCSYVVVVLAIKPYSSFNMIRNLFRLVFLTWKHYTVIKNGLCWSCWVT